MTPNMTNFEFGDVLLVPFPFTDQTTSKQRPAVVVSSKAYQAAKPDIIIMAITSQMHQGRSTLPSTIGKQQGCSRKV
jgi:mRNA interferase MazF